MRAARSLILLALNAACGDDATIRDAGAQEDAELAIDSGQEDAVTPDAAMRAAIVGRCADITGPHGLTAEVTDWGGYIPSISVTITVGSIARFGYADGGTEHTIVSGKPGMPDGLFASAPFVDHGTLTCIRFDAPGSYPVHCDRHPTSMERGTVTVVR